MDERVAMELRTHESIRDIGEATWNALVGADAPPFLSFEWLDALEQTGCVKPEKGWLPMHLTLSEGSRVVAGAPAYLKGNSEGEFVFDYAWANFAEGKLRIEYYPKIVVAVPFTPATGTRVLVADGFDPNLARTAMAQGLGELVERVGASSAHVLFPTEIEARTFERVGMLRRAGIQFHWHNHGYSSFDDFLKSFTSKRRNQIRRERREIEKQGIVVESVLGKDLSPALVDFVYEFYLATVQKHYWGRRYLCRDFFHEVCTRLGDRIHVVIAKERGSSRPIAGAFNLLGKKTLYGRYWGALEERRNLHFEVCYYRGIEDAIARGIELFEPGAGGEHKTIRGFLPSQTHSAHSQERDAIEAFVAEPGAA